MITNNSINPNNPLIQQENNFRVTTERNFVEEVLQKEQSIENTGNNQNLNELTKDKTVNDLEKTQLNQQKENIENTNIKEGKADPSSVLGQNIDVKV